jgi:hypothetical protein
VLLPLSPLATSIAENNLNIHIPHIFIIRKMDYEKQNQSLTPITLENVFRAK